MKITTRLFDQILRKEFDPLLTEKLGFSYEEGSYSRTLADGLIQMIIVDVGRSKESCRVMLGLNAAVLRSGGGLGAYFAQYLTPGGITDRPADLRWKDRELLEKLAAMLGRSLNQNIEGWLARYSTVGAFADALSEVDDYVKGLAYLHSGKPDLAELWLERYRVRIARFGPSGEQQAAFDKVGDLLSRLRGG